MAEPKPLDLFIYMQQQRFARHKRKPQVVAAPVASGSLTVGSTLSCTTGTFSGGAPYAYAYQWYRNGVLIAGATAAAYLTVLAGSHTCAVTATAKMNAFQSATSNALAVV